MTKTTITSVEIREGVTVSQTATDFRLMADRFVEWLERHGVDGYDPYDVWGTSYGKLARRTYYSKNPVGIAMTAPLILMEIILPQIRAILVKKKRYPTADAQLGLAFLNMHEVCQRCGDARASRWLAKAKSLAGDLLIQSVPGFKGNCWGYPFDWQHVNGLMPKNTPHITATPYCYELFASLFDLTGERAYLDVAASISKFVFEDLKDTPTGRESAASSYTPYDQGKVVNASAYRAFVLFDAAERLGRDDYRERAMKNLRFILESQGAEGSWLYAIDNPAEAFIDHFHTCFVLKCLFKLNRHLRSPEVKNAVEKGYRWYRENLYDERDSPRSFAIAHRLQIVRLEMYNVAEAISLGVLLRSDLPDAFSLAQRLAAAFLRPNQVRRGYWVTRVYLGGIRHTFPYLRWPQSQLFLALTNLLLAEEDGNRGRA
jgi:hypothetical protein